MTYILGTDASHWSGDIDFGMMYNAGARFWITKATDAYKVTGKQFVDSKFQTYCENATHQEQIQWMFGWKSGVTGFNQSL